MAKDRKKMREELAKRTEESYKRKDDTGRFGSYIKDDIANPGWNCGEGDHLLDIIPYAVGANHPRLEEGAIDYVLDIWVHQNVGPNQDQYVCPARNYNKPCPICEYQEQLRKDPDFDEDLVKSLNPKRRCVYNVVCYDGDEEKKGVQIWEVAHWFMERYLTPLAKDPRTGELIPFCSPGKDGKSIAFTRKGTGQQNTEYLGHKLVDRDYEIPDTDLDVAVQLDMAIEVVGYDELYKIFHGEDKVGKEGNVEKVEKVEKVESGPVSRRSNSNQAADIPPTEENKNATEGGKKTCPNGGVFGSDLDKLDGCNTCDIYDDCAREAIRLEEAGKGPAPVLRRR